MRASTRADGTRPVGASVAPATSAAGARRRRGSWRVRAGELFGLDAEVLSCEVVVDVDDLLL